MFGGRRAATPGGDATETALFNMASLRQQGGREAPIRARSMAKDSLWHSGFQDGPLPQGSPLALAPTLLHSQAGLSSTPCFPPHSGSSPSDFPFSSTCNLHPSLPLLPRQVSVRSRC